MKKIAALHEFIANLDLFAAEQMDSYVDDLVITPTCYPTGAGEIVVAEQDYTASFFIERYPHGRTSASVLIAHISAWLLDNDTNRTEGTEFPMILDVLDTETANLEFGIKFNELILARPDAGGTLSLKGVRYALL